MLKKSWKLPYIEEERTTKEKSTKKNPNNDLQNIHIKLMRAYVRFHSQLCGCQKIIKKEKLISQILSSVCKHMGQ